MKRVLIVCSVHQETGKATTRELDWLLNRLRPDVLFIECSPTDYPAFLDGTYGTLESAVVRRYRRHHEVMLEPVDLHLPDVELLKPEVDELFERFEMQSPRYCQLVSANRECTVKWGFAYLNSPDNARLEREIQREMRTTVETVGDSDLTELYALWVRTNDLREQEMIRRVEAFASRTSFKKGVLLLGSAHKPSLFEKSQLPCDDGGCVVAWDDDWHRELANPDGDVGPDGHPID